MEEERELELERLFESGIVQNMNRHDEQIGSGAADAENIGLTLAPAAEATVVSKQTADTLTAGEKIIEAIELADAERAAQAAFEEAKSKLSAVEAAKLQPPAPNAMLAALDLEPAQYVLDTLEKISNTALLDALLVLPFSNVLSMMVYLNEWASTVSSSSVGANMILIPKSILGKEHRIGHTNTRLLTEDASQTNRCPPITTNCTDPAPETSARYTTEAKRHDDI